MADLQEAFALLGYLKGVIDLKRNHCGEINLAIVNCQLRMIQWMTARLYGDQLQTTFYGTNHHHLACDIIERHTEQGYIALTKSKEIIGDTGRSQHTTLLCEHRLRSTRRTACLHVDKRAVVIPF